MRKYQISRNAKKTNIKKCLLASCALFILPFLSSGAALAQDIDDQFASVPANNLVQIAPRITLNETDKAKLRAAVNSSARVETSRDKYRHPEQTIEFFGIKPDATVVEIWPGQGWYTSILGPYLKSGGGHLVAANFDTATTNSDLVQKVVDSFKDKFSAQPEIYGDVKVVPFGPRSAALTADGSVDAVLTFRNIHNWMAQGWSDKAFDDFYRALKPGGILGIEEHRADEDTPQDPMAADGYVRQDYVISLAKDAGFELVDASEINANSKDTKDHPFGVWTLPPVMRTAPMGQTANPKFDIGRYNAIGESDRMTLLFRKPLKSDKPAVMAAKVGPVPIPVFFTDKKSKKDKAITKADTKVTAVKDDIKSSIISGTTKADAAKDTVVTALTPPIWNKDVKTTAVKEAVKTPSWDKEEPKIDAVKADVATIAQSEIDKIKETNADTVVNGTKPVAEVSKKVDADVTIPVLPSNIITSEKPPEVKPSEAPVVSEVKTAIETKPEVKTTQTTNEHPAKPAILESKTQKADSKKEKSTVKAASKTPPKATNKSATNAKTEDKVAGKPAMKSAAKKATDSKTKTAAKTTAKAAVKTTAKNTAKTTAKTTAKPAAKPAAKTTKPATKPAAKPAAKTAKKPASKTTAAAKPTTKSKNPSVPDWTASNKKKK